MRSLFLKIFLWFWLSVILISLTTVIITAIMQSNSESTTWQNQAFVAAEAARAVDIYEREGAEALKKHFEGLPKRPMYAYLLDESGKEVLGQKLPEQAIQLAHKEFGQSLSSFLLRPGGEPHENDERLSYTPVRPQEGPAHPLTVAPLTSPSNPAQKASPVPVIAEQVIGSSGRRYTFLIVIPPLSIKVLLASIRIGMAVQWGAILFLVGIFCFWLARHISAPVVQLRESASQIADGRLSTRVPQAVRTRRDEIGVLGQHFDRMAERIESLVSGQQRLLSTVSHELRSPLTRLSLAAGLLRQRSPEQTDEYLDRIELETEQLDKLISQLLTFSRIESGAAANATKEQIDLVGLIQEIAADGNFEARARPCIVCVGPLESCVMLGIAEQVRRAIENVVRNAIRYTKLHSRVEISLRRKGTLPDATALIQVRDYGPGVPDADLEKIFLPFYRISSAEGANSDGSGLGLAITERIVRRHGGTMRALNAQDGGLLVEMEFPLS